MNHILSFIDFLLSAGRFIILLGVLVFVHELGHFLAAKLTNVYVVRLSLGFGKRLFGFKRGETDYCISAIPLGGYVRMVGQEDMPRTREELEQAEPELANVPPERRFDTQPVRTKLAISFAGPLMNLLFAIPVLWLVFIVGIRVPIYTLHTRIGTVAEDSPADRAGIEPGDRIVSINGAPIEKWEQVQLAIWTNEGTPLDLTVENPAGEMKSVTVVPAIQGESSRATIGIEPLYTVAIGGIVPGMPAEKSGLQEGDIILTYNRKKPTNENLSKLIETVNKSAGSEMVLTVLRNGRTLDVTLVPETVRVVKGVEFHKNEVVYVEENGGEPTTQPKLRPGDIVTAINDHPLEENDVERVLAATVAKLHNLEGERVELAVRRPSKLLREPETFTATAPLVEKGMIGVLFSPTLSQQFGPGKAFIRSFDAFGNSFTLTMKTIYFLISGKVSTREMAGPIGIAFMTEETLKLGLGYYLNLVAFITINLAILNLLPIPVLDGGLILLTLIEFARRKPIDEKHLILLQRVGFVFILLLIFVATYNDIRRAINYLFGGDFLE